jgi:hypothetical protein
VSTEPKDEDAWLKVLGARVREERDESAPDGEDGVPPFDDAAADRIAELLLGGKTEAKATPVETQVAPPVLSQPASAPPLEGKGADANAPDHVVRPGRFWWAIAPFAAAAAILLGVALRPESSTLPAYEMSVIAAKAQRSDPSASPTDVTLDANGDLELVARPKTPSSGIAARAVLVRDGSAMAWAAPIEVSSDGAVRIVGATKRLFPETKGRYTIVLLLADPARLPSAEVASRIAVGAEKPNASVHVLRAEVLFLER